MPSYGSLHSPSLHKMNGHMEEGSSRERRGLTSRFSFGRLQDILGIDIAKCWQGILLGILLLLRQFPLHMFVFHMPVLIAHPSDVSDIAGLDDRLHCLPHIRHSIGLSQLRVVGDCLHAVLYCWDISGSGIGLGANVSSSGEQGRQRSETSLC